MSQSNRLTQLALLGMALATASAAAAVLLWPLEAAAPPVAPPPPARAAAPASKPCESFAEYASVCQRPLNQPVVEQPVVAATAATRPQSLRLLATLIEPGHAYAVIRLADGKEKLAAVGEVVDGIEVKSVTPISAVVVYQGRSVELVVQKKETPL